MLSDESDELELDEEEDEEEELSVLDDEERLDDAADLFLWFREVLLKIKICTTYCKELYAYLMPFLKAS